MGTLVHAVLPNPAARSPAVRQARLVLRAEADGVLAALPRAGRAGLAACRSGGPQVAAVMLPQRGLLALAQPPVVVDVGGVLDLVLGDREHHHFTVDAGFV